MAYFGETLKFSQLFTLFSILPNLYQTDALIKRLADVIKDWIRVSISGIIYICCYKIVSHHGFDRVSNSIQGVWKHCQMYNHLVEILKNLAKDIKINSKRENGTEDPYLQCLTGYKPHSYNQSTIVSLFLTYLWS